LLKAKKNEKKKRNKITTSMANNRCSSY